MFELVSTNGELERLVAEPDPRYDKAERLMAGTDTVAHRSGR